MWPENSKLIYSYRDFSAREKIYRGDISEYTLDSFDFIDLRSYSDEEVKEFIEKYFDKYDKDICRGNQDYFRKYFFKEYCVKMNNEKDDCITEYFTYRLSNWNDIDRSNLLDSRTINMDIYKYDNLFDEYWREFSVILKADHLFQLGLDIGRLTSFLNRSLKNEDIYLDDPVSSEKVNLYVLPIYLLNKDDDQCYSRISNIGYGSLYGWNYGKLSAFLDKLLDMIIVFCATNFYMVELSTDNGKVVVPSARSNGRKITFSQYTEKAICNKKVRISLFPDSNDYDGYLRIDGMKSNILDSKESSIPRKLCDYRYTVKGHVAHYWCGTGKNKHLEERWIDSYEKNKNKPYRIVKEYK